VRFSCAASANNKTPFTDKRGFFVLYCGIVKGGIIYCFSKNGFDDFTLSKTLIATQLFSVLNKIMVGTSRT
jgi:hypothetical protein